ncbi:hypothetical protein AQUCO_02300216v1 [Aquilegia coerulea]|uniref:Transcription factor TFIIIC triple barrel domain-containing protein n=1 Tax=Aquilegia coerulea TaxID=218851 RepID=A0A2G5DCT8_AQUCA|nr:hypothetical protein AQUCO_02300216v1 [Aquilegia coerulea]
MEDNSNRNENVVEEEYVLLDLEAVYGQMNIPANTPYVLSGLDTLNPILTIGDNLKLIGEYDETIGTCYVFTETVNSPCSTILILSYKVPADCTHCLLVVPTSIPFFRIVVHWYTKKQGHLEQIFSRAKALLIQTKQQQSKLNLLLAFIKFSSLDCYLNMNLRQKQLHSSNSL